MYGRHYGYKTSVSKMMISHLKEKVERLKKSKIITIKNNVLDIGSNDASFLKLLKKILIYTESILQRKNLKRNIKV